MTLLANDIIIIKHRRLLGEKKYYKLLEKLLSKIAKYKAILICGLSERSSFSFKHNPLHSALQYRCGAC